MSTFKRLLKKQPQRSFRVADHAMERFRERVDEEFIYRGNDDLADLLNTRLRNAALVRDVTDPRSPKAVTTLYLFECRTGARQVAVVRDNCVVTVLEEWMARNNYPGWDDTTPGRLGTLGTTPLGTKLRALAPVLPAPPPPPPSQPQLPAESLALAVDCRELAAKIRALREQKVALEGQLLAVTNELQSDEETFMLKCTSLITLIG